jgi:squalene-associated FAD-dependent desaturase
MSTVHIVGAGLAGLSCAVVLVRAGQNICVWEGAGHAGGRCRSFDDSVTGKRLDNGNHLLLSANQSVLDYLDSLNARESLVVGEAVFPFVDVRSGARWCVRPGKSCWPAWLFNSKRNIPDIPPLAYLRLISLLFAGQGKRVGDYVATGSLLATRFLEPFTVAVLNTETEEADAYLTAKALRLSFARGEKACRPLMARQGLSESFVDPALDFLRDRNMPVNCNNRLRYIEFSDLGVQALNFVQNREALGEQDNVVLCVPPAAAATLIPGLEVPDEAAPIVNVHICLERKITLPEDAPILGIIGGTAQWFMLRDDILSATISAAHEIADWPNEKIAQAVWQDACRALNLSVLAMPSIRVIKERRATFLQTPQMVARRPGTLTAWHNLFLAGDWTNTGFPATLDGAVRSGRTAADAVLKRVRAHNA